MNGNKKKVMCQPKALILFDGKSNSGKTTTLRNLVELLATDGQSQQYITNVKNSLARHLTPQGHYKDLYIIVHYRDVDIFVATESDKELWVIAACYFFKRDYVNFHKTLPGTNIYTFDSMGNMVSVNDLTCYQPHLCISASHINRFFTHHMLDFSRQYTLLKEPIITRRWDYLAHIPGANNIDSLCNYFAERLRHLVDVVI